LYYVSLAFMFGAVMPLIWPIMCLCMIILYVLNRTLICYYYKMPPQYSGSLTFSLGRILNIIPFLTLPMTVWQLGNKQIFDNVLFEIKSYDESRETGHTWDTTNIFVSEDSWALTHNALPLILLCIMLTLVPYFLIKFCWVKPVVIEW
jgi:hypothetical protein